MERIAWRKERERLKSLIMKVAQKTVRSETVDWAKLSNIVAKLCNRL